MKKTIKSERKIFHRKLFFELTGTLILLVTAVVLLCTGVVINPFHVVDIEDEDDIKSAYNNHISYVRLTEENLDFTGYYKISSKGNITYNCYVTTGYDTRFFVYIPVERTEDADGETIEKINSYSLVGRLRKDEKLISTVSADYDVTSKDFLEECSISDIVIDEAGAKRKEVLAIWIALIGLLSSYIVYVLVVLFVNRDMGGKQDGENQT